MAPTEMKGLKLFIGDLRSSSSPEEQEKRIKSEIVNIQKQFSSSSLSGYQRKKYVAKLCYISVLGKKVDFGVDQCLILISSGVYSEMSIGFLGLELLATADDLILIVEQLNKLIQSTNWDHVALALNFLSIAGTALMASSMLESVFSLFRSPTVPPMVKKKACAAFLKLAGHNPDMIEALWVQRILSLLSNDELVLSVLPLIQFLSQNHLELCQSCIPQLTSILQQTITADANPWLVVEIVSLLNVIMTTLDQSTLGKLRVCVTKAIELSQKSVAHTTIFFTIVNFASKLEPSKDALQGSVTALCTMLQGETNGRYLALDSLAKLCVANPVAALAARHLLGSKILPLLHDRDNSVVKKTLDLVFSLVDSDNLQMATEALLEFLKTCPGELRTDVAVKVAVMAERHATTYEWFVHTSLKLLSSGFQDDTIWQRIVQIVVNNESLHKITCDELVKYLNAPHTSESLVKVAAYIIGEYGDSLSFELLCDKYFTVPNVARGMVLTALLKLYHRDNTLYSKIIKFYQLELNSIDFELQQRCLEYLNYIQKDRMGVPILDIVLEEMPVFMSTKNPLLERLAPSAGSTRLSNSPLTSLHPSATTLSSAPSTPSAPSVPAPRQTLTSNWEEGFNRMLVYNAGVFYENGFIKILYRCNKINNTFQMNLTYVNKTPKPISGLSTLMIPYDTENNPAYIVNQLSIPDVTIPPNGRVGGHICEVLVRNVFKDSQACVLGITFQVGGAFNSLKLKLPIVLAKTLSPVELDMSMFLSRSKQIADQLQENGEGTFTIPAALSYTAVRSILEKLQLGIVEMRATAFVFAAGVMHTKNSNAGCLVKIKLGEDFTEINVKSTIPQVGEIIAGTIKQALAK